MMEQIKKYIRGNTKRGHEIIAELEKLGGKNTLKLKGNEYDKVYYISRNKYNNDANTIDFVAEKSFIGQLIVTHPDWEEIELPKYPKNYEECCKVMGVNHTNELDFREHCDYKTEITYYEDSLLEKIETLYRLIICRDAYWKIAGEEMGLGKPWEPDWKNGDEKKWVISRYRDELDFGFNIEPFRIFAFPTEEMLYAFKKNFDPDLEICKELL